MDGKNRFLAIAIGSRCSYINDISDDYDAEAAIFSDRRI